MAINNPRVIGLCVRCKKCGWIFRCPAEQPKRNHCMACESRLISLNTNKPLTYRQHTPDGQWIMRTAFYGEVQ